MATGRTGQYTTSVMHPDGTTLSVVTTAADARDTVSRARHDVRLQGAVFDLDGSFLGSLHRARKFEPRQRCVEVVYGSAAVCM